MIKSLIIFIFLTSFPLFADSNPSYPPNPNEQGESKTSPAFSAANAQAIYWINLLDQHQYGGSWLGAAALLREVISENQWIAAMQGTRKTLGPAYTRKVTSHQFTQQLPLGTRGNFVIIKYDTNFYGKAGYVETVTLMTEGQLAQWKVLSYEVRKGR